MSNFVEIKGEELNRSPFEMIGKQWMLITAEKEGIANAMTASWGGLGVLWNKNVAYIVVRKSRYTKDFIDNSEHFSITFYDREKYAKMLQYMGTVSGREEDKIAKMQLTLDHEDGIPYFTEASTVMLCKKMCRQPLEPQNFLLEEIDSSYYKDKDYHELYIGEIVKIMKQ